MAHDEQSDRPPVWPGGSAFWLWAAPAIVTCGNFGLFLAVSFPRSPVVQPWLSGFANDVYVGFGGGFLGMFAVMAGLTPWAALPGAAFLLRRDGLTPRGRRNAVVYSTAMWLGSALSCVGLMALLSVLL